MKILCDSGIVVSRKEGKWTYYSISEEGSLMAAELLQVLTNSNHDMVNNVCSCHEK